MWKNWQVPSESAIVDEQEKQLPAIGSHYVLSAALQSSQADTSDLAFESLQFSEG